MAAAAGGNPVGARKRSFLVQEITGWRQNDVRRRCGSITVLCAPTDPIVTPSPTVNQPLGNTAGAAQWAKKRTYAFGGKTAECVLPPSRSLRRRALSGQCLALEDALKSRQRGRPAAAPSPSKNIRRAEGAARRIEATEISSGCRSVSRGSNRAAESGRTVYRARLRQPHRG